MRRVAVGMLGIAVLVAAALLVYLRDLDGKARAMLLDRCGELGAQIGRRISLGEVHVALGLVPEIVVHDIEVGPAEGARGELAVPALRIHAVRLAVALGPLIRSGAIEVTRFQIEGPEVTLIRSAEGLSIDDVRKRVATAPRRPPSGKQKLALRSLAITGGKLRIHEIGTDEKDDRILDRITLTGRDLTLDAPSRLSLAAAVLAPEPNVSADLDLAPAATGAGLELKRAEVHASTVRLGPALRWAGAAGRLDDALLDAAMTVEVGSTMGLPPAEPASLPKPGSTMGLPPAEPGSAPSPGASVAVKGQITLARVRLAGNAPATLSLGIEAVLDPSAATLAVPSFEIAVARDEGTSHVRGLDGGVKAQGRLSLRDLTGTPTVEALEVDARGDAAAVCDLLPQGRLPPGIAVSGPVLLSLRGGGSADDAHALVQLAVDDVRALETGASGTVSEGHPVSVSLDAALAFSRSAGRLTVSDAAIHAGEVAMHGNADLRGIGVAPAIEALEIEASAPGEALFDLVPPKRRPPAVTLRGPLLARLSARGSRDDLRGKLAVDLGPATVHARGFAKPAGVPLDVTLEGGVARGVELDRAELHLGTLALSAHGTVHDAGQLDLAFASPSGSGPSSTADLAALLRLFPGAAERLGSGTVIGGRLAASGRVRRSGGQTTIDLTTRLRDASLHRALAGVSGAVEASAHVEVSAGASDASVQGDLDLTGADVDVVPVIAKRAGRPAHLTFTLARKGDRVSLSDAHVTLPGVTLEGLTAERSPARVHVALGGATIALAPIVDMAPLLQGVLPPPLAGATVRFGLDLDGAPDALGAAELRIPSIDITGGLGHVAGAVQIDGLPPRALRFEVSHGDLDLSGFERAEPSMDELPGGAPQIRIEGQVHLDSVKAAGETARAVDAEVSFDNGRLSVGSLHINALGGTVVVEKSYLDLTRVPELELHARSEGIDLSRFARPSAEGLRGRAKVAIDLHGQGEGWERMARSLRGSARLEVRDLHVKAVFPRPKITVVNPAFAILVKREAQRHAGEPRTLDAREVSADFEVLGGKAATRSPLLLRSDDFTLRLTGTLGEGAALALDGKVEIPPHVIAAATKHALVPVRPIPLRLRLFDDGGGRKLEILELGETAAAFLGALRNAVDNAAMPVP